MDRDYVQMSRGRVILGLALVFLAGGLAGGLIAGKFTRPALAATNPSNPPVSQQVSFTNGFEPVVKKVLPSVVNIASSKVVRSSDRGQMPFFSDPFFREFFGDDFSRQFRIPREQREHSLGSGVIVDSEGHVITNSHVVEGASEIKVSLSDHRELHARLIGSDPKADIAVLKLDAKNLPALPFGDSTHVHVGDFALAVGNPFGVGQTVTMGIISATGRGGLGIEEYEDFIQTDAAVNPGNSGGALVNVRAELVGINTAIVTGGGGGSQGIGFAVPANMACQVMDQILKHGRVIRGWLGVSVQPVTPAIASAFHLPEARGALIGDVSPGSPAEGAGLKTGDVIVSLNGQPVTDSRDLSLRISMTAPGSTVKLKYLRDGGEHDVSVKLGELPSKGGEGSERGEASGGRLGISVGQLTPTLARELHVPRGTTGVVVTDVQSGTRAEDAGVQSGDVIEAVNHKPVTNVREFLNAVSRLGNQPVLLKFNRRGEHLFVVIEQR